VQRCRGEEVQVQRRCRGAASSELEWFSRGAEVPRWSDAEVGTSNTTHN